MASGTESASGAAFTTQTLSFSTPGGDGYSVEGLGNNLYTVYHHSASTSLFCATLANAVCPGPTDTPLFRRQPERLQEALERAVPMRRLAQPEDIAHAIVFFAGEGAGYITGQVLSVSGGLTMSG